MNTEIVGKCANCHKTVVFVDDGFNGFRLCTGCNQRGPNAILESEVPVAFEFIDMEEELCLDDQTIVEGPPVALVERSRWRV